MQKINDAILTPIIVLLFALAVVYFLFGVAKFVRNQDNETELEAGKQHMVWGVVGISIMVAVYGILNLIQSSVAGIR